MFSNENNKKNQQKYLLNCQQVCKGISDKQLGSLYEMH